MFLLTRYSSYGGADKNPCRYSTLSTHTLVRVQEVRMLSVVLKLELRTIFES
jgi:hypothetical protein